MNLQELRIVVSKTLEEKKPGMSLSVEQFNIMLNIAQIKHFKRWLGLPEEYTPGMWLTSQLPEVTRITSEALKPFIVYMGKKDESPLMVTGGYANIPADYYYPLSMFYKFVTALNMVKTRTIEICTDKKWAEVLSSAVVFPTVNRPYCNFKDTYIQFQPDVIRQVHFSYIRKPKTTVYAIKESPVGYEYDPDNSVELEWNDTNQIDIINILLGDLGVVARRMDIKAISEQVKAKGI